MEELLPVIWFGIIGFAVFMYVFLDGFVLGVGILSGAANSESDRDTMMNSVAPVWDGNETWLVLGGTGLFAAFPPVYSAMLPAFYLPISFMLIALIFRGVAFGFRFRTERKWIWNIAFCSGSIFATFFQGIILGGIVQGVEVEGNQYAGNVFDWLTPFSIMTGIALLPGYAMLGASWLILKTEGELQLKAYQQARYLLLMVSFFLVLVSLSVPFLNAEYAKRWFSWPNIAYLSSVPIVTATVIYLLYRALEKRQQTWPFLLSLSLFGISFAGLAISIWPTILPPSLTIYNSASPAESQLFLGIGLFALLPFILFYTGYTYWVFRGKVTVDSSYH